MQILSVREAATAAGVSENSVRLWLADGKIPKADHNGLVGVPLRELTAFLAERAERKGGTLNPPQPAHAKPKPAAKPKAEADGAGDGTGPLTVNQAAALAGVSGSNVYFWIKDNKFPTIKRGNSRLIPRKGFERFLAKYQAGGGNARTRNTAAPSTALTVTASSTTAPATAAAPASGSGGLLTTTEAAALLQVTQSTLYRFVAEKRFATVKQGHARMVDRASLEAFRATYTNPKAPKEPPPPDPRQTHLPFSAVRALARGEEREAEFGGEAPKADTLARLDMAEAIGAELGLALANYRKHVLRTFLTEQLAKLDRED